MTDLDVMDNLLAEDDPHDAELTMMAFKKHNVTSPLHWVEDGEKGT